MAVEVRLPTVLRTHTNGEATVRSEGDTVGAVFADLVARFPGVGGQLRSVDGDIPRFVNVYVNDEDIRYLDKLDTKVAGGDVISILPAVAGGA